jgi:hypothetical protein
MRMNVCPECEKSLLSLGYDFQYHGNIYGKRHYKTTEGDKAVWIYQRFQDYRSRYYIGVWPVAMENSDEIILWSSRERNVFFIPSNWLLENWRNIGSPMSRGQFDFNLQWNNFYIERLQMGIKSFARCIPERI